MQFSVDTRQYRDLDARLRQTSESRLRFLKINNKHTRILQNNSCFYGKHESTSLHLVTANGKRQIGRNHGHVVTSAVSRKRES